MSRRKFLFRLPAGVLTLVVIAGLALVAAAFSYSNAAPGYVDGLGAYVRGTITRTVDVDTSQPITDVNVTVDFQKINDWMIPGADCSNPGPGWSYSDEVSLTLQSPMGTVVNLVYDSVTGPTYPNQGHAERVQVTFDDEAGALVGTTNGGLPESGTFRPEEPLSAFDFQNPDGIWTLTVGDNYNGDGLCYFGFTLTLFPDPSAPVVDNPPPWDPGDDRLNRQPAQPVALYCRDEGIFGYGPAGEFVLFAGNDVIEAVGVPTSNTLLASSADGSAALYRLSSGEFQANITHDGQLYVFRWDGCPLTHKVTEVFDAMTGERLVYHENDN